MSLRRFFRRWRSDAELLQEIDTYLTEEIAENMARGMSRSPSGPLSIGRFIGTTALRRQL
jgi:hypothetical protein